MNEQTSTPINLQESLERLTPLNPIGTGHNSSLMTMANEAYRAGIPMEDGILHAQNEYDPTRNAQDVVQAFEKVWGRKGLIPEASKSKPKYGTLQEEKLTRFSRMTRAKMVAESPSPVITGTKEIIQSLYDPDAIINMQVDGRSGGTLFKCSNLPENIDAFKYLSPAQFKHLGGCPNPNQGGKTGYRIDANVKSRDYMILEFDPAKGDLEGQAKCERFNSYVNMMARYAPLKLAVYSGGKSVHFWFDTKGVDKRILEAFFTHAVQHGADKALATRSQVCRMPNVSAGGEGRGSQEVIYFDPACGSTWDLSGFESQLDMEKLLELYYNGGNYYMSNDDNVWTSYNRTSILHQLISRGIRGTKVEGEAQSPADLQLVRVEQSHCVSAVMNGASGRDAGCYTENGIKFLVKTSPHKMKPVRGDWSVLRKFFLHMFREEPSEYEILLGYLSSAVKDFRNNGQRQSRMSPRQALFLAGDASSGKTVLKQEILPYLFGGRAADASSMFGSNASDFNSEIFASEVLFLDDTSVLGPSRKERHIMSEQIKEICVGSGKGYHSKGVDRINARPWWCLFRFMNMEEGTLDTLPLNDDGMSDKWILLKASAMAGGGIEETKGNKWYDDFKADIMDQLPCFLYYLLKEHEISEEVEGHRFSVKSYKNASLMAKASEGSVESSLHYKINTSASAVLFQSKDFDDKGLQVWRGTVAQLQADLQKVGEQSEVRAFEKMCPTPNALTSQLKELEKSYPDQFAYSDRAILSPRRLGKSHYWQITPPITSSDCF
jgi:hypothetical protein